MIIERYPNWLIENHDSTPGLDRILARIRFLRGVTIAYGDSSVWVIDALPQHAELLEFEGFKIYEGDIDVWYRPLEVRA